MLENPVMWATLNKDGLLRQKLVEDGRRRMFLHQRRGVLCAKASAEKVLHLLFDLMYADRLRELWIIVIVLEACEKVELWTLLPLADPDREDGEPAALTQLQSEAKLKEVRVDLGVLGEGCKRCERLLGHGARRLCF